MAGVFIVVTVTFDKNFFLSLKKKVITFFSSVVCAGFCRGNLCITEGCKGILFFSSSIVVFTFQWNSAIHFKLIFVYGVMYGAIFCYFHIDI